ncbi:competence protein [Bradyrhizobium guangdongense]|nr:competence protein [Bradyrhizobium guangdongense]
MSFAATLGLVALVQIGMPNLFASPDHSATARIALWGGREIVMLLLASLIAGLATTPYAAFHFHRVTPFGVLANLAAMPVVSALVMPAGLLGLLAAPFGLDSVFWWLMGVGIDWMVLVSRWVAALPGAIGRIAAFGIGPLIAASIAIILMGLLRTPLRWSGGIVLAASIAWALMARQPEILIAGDGHSVAVRGRDGQLHFIQAGKNAFLVKEWLAADGDARSAGDASLGDGVSCDEAGCVTPLADGRFIALSLRADALAEDCSRATLVVTAKPPAPDCPAMAIDRTRLQSQGALALSRNGDGFAVRAVRPRGANRPWSPAIAGDAEFETTLAPRPAASRKQDATPSEADLQAED